MLECGHFIDVIADLILSVISKRRLSDLSCINRLSTDTSVSAGCKYSQVSTSLMKTTRLSAEQKLLNDLLKVYSHKSLKCDCNGDFHELKTRQLNIYMACLYYSTKQYRTAAKHCVNAITSVQSSNNVNCIERQLLPQFDDNIGRVLGIILLYQFVLNSSLNQVQQAECNSDVYSVDSIAHYLAVMCLKQEHNDSNCCLQNESCIK